MAKKLFERNKVNVNEGTIGHIDHGKSHRCVGPTCFRNRLIRQASTLRMTVRGGHTMSASVGSPAPGVPCRLPARFRS